MLLAVLILVLVSGCSSIGGSGSLEFPETQADLGATAPENIELPRISIIASSFFARDFDDEELMLGTDDSYSFDMGTGRLRGGMVEFQYQPIELLESHVGPSYALFTPGGDTDLISDGRCIMTVVFAGIESSDIDRDTVRILCYQGGREFKVVNEGARLSRNDFNQLAFGWGLKGLWLMVNGKLERTGALYRSPLTGGRQLCLGDCLGDDGRVAGSAPGIYLELKIANEELDTLVEVE